MSNEDQSWLRRFRSSSFSSDLTVEVAERSCGNTVRQDSVEFKKSFKKAGDNGAIVISALESRKSMSPEEYLHSLQSAQQALSETADHFPFFSLPTDLQLLIFNYLTPAERGSVAVMCKSWYQLVRSPDLWWNVDLISFPPSSTSTQTDTEDEDYDESIANYTRYQRRTRKFINFLITIRPNVKKLRFAFDIADVKDGWMEGIETLLHSCHLQEIKVAEIIWNETPAKPAILDSVSITWCTSDYKDLMYKHRHRQRYFVKFFDLFTSICSSLVHLVVPFDWTERSFRSLSRLTNLRSIVLARYFIFQNFEQKQIDSLLCAIPNVTNLTFEVWTPSGRGLQSIKFHSTSLLSLDTTQCRGIKLDRDLHLPNLIRLHISINPMKGPMTGGPSGDGRLRGYDTDDEELVGGGDCASLSSSSCLYDVLRAGAPNLTFLNNLELHSDWLERSYPDLEVVLKSICICPTHAPTVNVTKTDDDDDDGGDDCSDGNDDDGDDNSRVEEW